MIARAIRAAERNPDWAVSNGVQVGLGTAAKCVEQGRDLQVLISTNAIHWKNRTGMAGSWPTATAGDAANAGNRNLEGSKAHAGTSLTDAVNGGQAPRKRWPSPDCNNARDGSTRRAEATGTHAMSLHHVVDELHGEQAPRRWTTPQHQDSKQASDSGIAPSSRDRDLLAAEVCRPSWSTPSANEDKATRNGTGTEYLRVQAGGALNPDWVACLMGWPVGWEDASKPLPQPVTFLPWPAPPGPQHPWEPPRLTSRVPGRTARLRMLGNGQVPATAVLAWRILSGIDP